MSCATISIRKVFKIIETDANEIGLWRYLKRKMNKKEKLVSFMLGIWNQGQQNYAKIKKKILAIVLNVTKFEEDLLNQKFFY